MEEKELKDKYYCPECGDSFTERTNKNKDGYIKVICHNCEAVYSIKRYLITNN